MRALVICTAAASLILVGCGGDTGSASDPADNGDVADTTDTQAADPSGGEGDDGEQEQTTDAAGGGSGVVTVGDTTWEFVPSGQCDVSEQGDLVQIWHEEGDDRDVPEITFDVFSPGDHAFSVTMPNFEWIASASDITDVEVTADGRVTGSATVFPTDSNAAGVTSADATFAFDCGG